MSCVWLLLLLCTSYLRCLCASYSRPPPPASPAAACGSPGCPPPCGAAAGCGGSGLSISRYGPWLLRHHRPSSSFGPRRCGKKIAPPHRHHHFTTTCPDRRAQWYKRQVLLDSKRSERDQESLLPAAASRPELNIKPGWVERARLARGLYYDARAKTTSRLRIKPLERSSRWKQRKEILLLR